MNQNEMALIKKDIREIVNSKLVIVPMIVVPIVLTVIIPIALLLGVYLIKDPASIINDFGGLIDKLPVAYVALSPEQLVIRIGLDFIFPSYFLIIPIMCSGIIGASSFVGEKEHKTLESLLYTPISMQQLLRAKILGVFIPSYLITLVSFIAFGIVMNIAGVQFFGKLIFPDWTWLIIIALISPAMNLLSLTFTVMVSARSKTFQEAQQISGILVLPIILLIIGQVTGVLMLSNLIMLIAGFAILLLDWYLIKRISSTFVPEKII